MIKTLTALAAAGTIALGTVATPSTAEAGGRGGALAAGIIGGLAVGAILGSAAAHGPYYYGYYRPGPYYYAPRCFWRRQRVWDGYGWRRARVRVCH